MRDALTAAIAFEGFHRQCNVLTMANLAQVVNVIHATMMTRGADMWLTPTYFVFQMHKPHIGAQALPVQVEHGASLPDGSSTVSATASQRDGQIAVTLTNRHYSQGAQVRLSPANSAAVSGQLLTASSPREQNSASDPERIKLQPLSLDTYPEGTVIELPPHSIATIVFSAS
jgi:alpha-N-arabinofuranosidase